MRAATMVLSFLVCSAGAARAECIAHSAPTRPHLVELFTSEGCSSCPPADAWLRGLPANAKVVPLEWHVDYWDALGWQDRFDDARYTTRQRELGARSAKNIVYTPEVALDGGEWRDWGRAPLLAGTQSNLSMTLHVVPGAPLRVALQTMPIAGKGNTDWRAYFVVTEDGLSSAVRAGENSGALLRHNDTVRAFAGPLPLDHASAELNLPSDLKPQRSAVVAFVQNPATGTIAQVLRQPLAQCR